MPVFERETIEKKTARDVARNQEKVMDALKERLWEVIASEDIITNHGQKKVRVPVRFLKSYYFKHGKPGTVGEGDDDNGDPGDPGEPGDEEGEELYDTELDLEKVIEMVMEDCGLPNLRDKKTKKIITSKSYKYDKVDLAGIRSLQDERLTAREATRRQAGFVARLRAMTRYLRQECENVLIKANGDIQKAIQLLSVELARVAKLSKDECRRRLVEGKRRGLVSALRVVRKSRLVRNPVKKKLFISEADGRYRVPEEKIELHSNAVVFALRDASGSMDNEKKFLSRIVLYWIVKALHTLYEHVEVKFALHTTEAELVNEHDFFYRSESGGTYGGSGYKLFQELEKTQYPYDEWNVYTFHFSDGEDFQPEDTVREALKLLLVCQMLGYGEIQYTTRTNWSELMGTFQKKLGAELKMTKGGIEVMEKAVGQSLFLGIVFSKREHILPVVREFLKKERELWQ